MDEESKISDIESALKSLFKEFNIGANDFVVGLGNMIGGAEKLNKSFGLGRQRIVEMMGSITEATPAITRLGGNIASTVAVMEDVSKATSRAVIAGERDVSKLFAAHEILQQDVQTMVSSFQDVGVEFTQVGKQLEDSILYIQSVGGNAKQIMTSVLQDMAAMNRFNFQNGIEGFSKMATKAAMMKIDMRTTLEFADRALDPDKAIEMSSAFQRLGISMGDLADPFQLMNKSLNDPAGLQDSLIKMTKQFSYFDEEAKQFKINPQGMLMLREIGNQLQIDSSSLSKMALNAADLDRKLSQIKPGINFTSEDDRLLLANLSKMNAQGKYEVKFGDDYVRLEELTQEQLDELIDTQKRGPQTLEEIQRSQMDYLQVLESDVKAIKDKIVFGVVSPETVRREIEGAGKAVTNLSGTLEESTDLKFFRDTTGKAMNKISSIIDIVQKEGFGSPKLMEEVKNSLGVLENMEDKVDQKTRDVIETFLRKNADNTSEIGKTIQKYVEREYDKSDLKKTTTPKQTQTVSPNVSHLSETMKETNTALSNKVTETNRLTSDGNQTLTSILSELKNDTKIQSTKVKEKDEITGEGTMVSYSNAVVTAIQSLTTMIQNPTNNNRVEPITPNQTNPQTLAQNTNNLVIDFKPWEINLNGNIKSDGTVNTEDITRAIKSEFRKEEFQENMTKVLKDKLETMYTNKNGTQVYI
jgi:hypothetical protein